MINGINQLTLSENMLASLKLHTKLWGLRYFFSTEKEDAIGTAKAIEQYLAKRAVKLPSALSGQLIKYLALPNRSTDSRFTINHTLLIFIKVLEQYNQLLSRISLLQSIEPTQLDNCLNLPVVIHQTYLIEALLAKNFSVTDLFNQDQMPFFGKTIELTVKVSNNLKVLEAIEEKMGVSENSLISLLKTVEPTIKIPQAPEKRICNLRAL